jgi:hypothetical protein
MPNPGDVVGFWSDIAGKHKFHLCICPTGKFLFLNSPKTRSYPGDFHVPCAEVPLDPTPEGYSVVSCTPPMAISEAELKRLNATTKDRRVSNKVLKELLEFVETLSTLSQDEKDEIINGLADWL